MMAHARTVIIDGRVLNRIALLAWADENTGAPSGLGPPVPSSRAGVI